MPRKMYRNPEAEPTPERPGSGSPDDSGVRRRPRKEEEKSVMIDPEYQRAVERVKSKKPNVVVDPEYREEVGRREERHAGHQAAVRELVEDAEREESAKHEGVRENVDELLGMERERMAEEAKLARRERLAGMKKQVDEMRASLLKQEQADLAERMEKLGGVWGGEEYFKLQDRLERTE
ncbi:MAG: hypothetical protein NUW08_04005, partial [Candidatus Uhrbacteria bacterium]|nr:hypothetical protein [Candidatus Uhrbacteria bacterium]